MRDLGYDAGMKDIWHVVAHSVHNLAQKTIEPIIVSTNQYIYFVMMKNKTYA